MSNLCVLDTNVIISAAIFEQSIPRQAFDQALAKEIILVSEPIVQEISKVLKRKKYDRYLSFQARNRLLKTLLDKAIVVEIEQSIQACRDPKDNKFLELAVCGNATVIISGDNDLLELNPFRGIQIITPQKFLTLVK